MVFPDYGCWNIIFICSTIRRNLHENIRRNGRSTWRILYLWRYIDTYKIYLWSLTSITLLVQVINQYNEPQGGVQKFKTDTCLLYRVNELGTVINIVYVDDPLAIGENQHWWIDWMHQEIICNSINGWTRVIHRMYNQAWPHQNYPQYLSTGSNYQDDSRI